MMGTRHGRSAPTDASARLIALFSPRPAPAELRTTWQGSPQDRCDGPGGIGNLQVSKKGHEKPWVVRKVRCDPTFRTRMQNTDQKKSQKIILLRILLASFKYLGSGFNGW